MNQKDEYELKELYNDLREEARVNSQKRKHERIMLEQVMKVCSKEELINLLDELENKKRQIAEFMMVETEKN